MKSSTGILMAVIALAVALLLSNPEPVPANRDPDVNTSPPPSAPQDDATAAAAADDKSAVKLPTAVPEPVSVSLQNQSDVDAAIAEAAKALASANEDSPNVDAALERALEQLQKARQALAPTHCGTAKSCAVQDACIVVQLPPIEYGSSAYTARGTLAFATIFAAAAARGIENASIRAMNATRVCPTCKVSHSATTPCPEVPIAPEEPPSELPD